MFNSLNLVIIFSHKRFAELEYSNVLGELLEIPFLIRWEYSCIRPEFPNTNIVSFIYLHSSHAP